MSTVGQQGGRIFPVGLGIGATQLGWAVISPMRAAGMLPMSTVKEPSAMIPAPQEHRREVRKELFCLLSGPQACCR